MIESKPDATARSHFAVCNQRGWDTERLYFAQNWHELGGFCRNPIGMIIMPSPLGANSQATAWDDDRRRKLDLVKFSPTGSKYPDIRSTPTKLMI